MPAPFLIRQELFDDSREAVLITEALLHPTRILRPHLQLNSKLESWERVEDVLHFLSRDEFLDLN